MTLFVWVAAGLMLAGVLYFLVRFVQVQRSAKNEDWPCAGCSCPEHCLMNTGEICPVEYGGGCCKTN